ncbi:MAG: xanthine dehydrogenase family protein subunit M [Deltaproteobacteria bacterium]|nr:xanthine dehydrogenase family protein subunit M [Deltaproteobacteria bacterium]
MTRSGFTYTAPESIEEAVGLLARLGENAYVMAGGTDLLIKRKHGLIKPEAVVALKRIKNLDRISIGPKKGLVIGATALIADVAAHPSIRKIYPAIADAAQNTANVQIRNMGTIVGNICNASPSADNAPTLLAMGATLSIAGPDGSRSLPLEDFFKGPGITALKPAEIVTAVTVPPPPPASGAAYVHLSARGKVDCSAVCVGTQVVMQGLKVKDARVFVGACAPVPIRAPKAERAVIDTTFSERKAEKAGESAAREAAPITDVRATRDYRNQMVAVLTKRALIQACKRARRA